MDKKKLGIIIGAVVAVLALGAGAFMFLNKGSSASSDTTSSTEATPTPAPTTPAPGGASVNPRAAAMAQRQKMAGGASGGIGAPTGGNKEDSPRKQRGGIAAGADPFGKGPANATPANATAANPAAGAKPGAPGAPAAVLAPPLKVRPDPFLVAWRTPPQPPYIFDQIQPIRLASANVEAPPAKPIEVREVPSRRVSGIMSGDGVFAILEQNGDSEIVKPGSQTSDGYRVVSIDEDSVKLQRREGNAILTQIVPLSDAPTGPSAPRVGGFPGGGFRGNPGGLPGPQGGRGGGGGFGGGGKGGARE